MKETVPMKLAELTKFIKKRIVLSNYAGGLTPQADFIDLAQSSIGRGRDSMLSIVEKTSSV